MAQASGASLQGLGFPSDRLASLAAAAGLSVRSSIDGAADRVVVLLGHAWDGVLSQYWGSPRCAWIEVAELADRAILELIGAAVRSDLFASFTTITANQMELASTMLAVIQQRHPVIEETRDNIELALHESLSNALIHGNLQMEGMGALNVEALETFSNNLMERIADPEFANRRIDVICGFEPDAIVIDVVDQGCGFVPKPKTQAKASGRGLDLICASCQSFQLLDGGRRVSMRFPA